MMYSLTLVCILVHVYTSIISVSAASDMCQSKINRHNDMCYWIDTTGTSFSEAQQRCAASGGNLATIDNAETSWFLKDHIDEKGFEDVALWIGYDERNSTWNDGTPFSWSNYGIGEPSRVVEYCTFLAVRISDSMYRWGDGFCHWRFQGLCQIQVQPVSQYEFVGIDEGTTVTVGDRVVVVETDSVISCGVECARDVYCSRFRYIQADRFCTMYYYGSLTKTVDIQGEWFRY